MILSFLDAFRKRSALRRLIEFVGYFYLALWNHLFNKVPSYAFRHFIARRLYGLRLGRRSSIHFGVTFLSPWRIRIGNHCNIQMGCFLDGRGEIEIGDNVDITPGVRILTEQHDIDSPDYATVMKKVVIHDHAVIGSYALILPGVTIGEGAVVAAGSVVVKDIPAYCMAAGNPAVTKRDRKRDIRYRLDFRRPFH